MADENLIKSRGKTMTRKGCPLTKRAEPALQQD